jgi:NADH-quinone oxidoreductase subunit K
MSGVPIEHVLLLAGILFALGVVGLLARRNAVFILMSLEIMLNAAGLAFIAAGARWGQPDGQAMFLFLLAAGAVEVAVGLGLLLRMNRQLKTLDADRASAMRG